MASYDGQSAMPPQTLWARRLKEFGAEKPVTLNDHVKTAYAMTYLNILRKARMRELQDVARTALGPDVVKKQILDGCSPDALTRKLADQASLDLALHDMLQKSESLALVLSCALVLYAQSSDPVLAGTGKQDMDEGQSIIKMKAYIKDLEQTAPDSSVVSPAIDYSTVYEFIRAKKFSGGLDNFLAWKDNGGPRSWKSRLEKKLVFLRKDLDDAIAKRQAFAPPPDQGLIHIIPGSALREILSSRLSSIANYITPTVLLNAPLTDVAIVETVFDMTAMQSLAIEIRSDFVEAVKQGGNRFYEQGKLAEAEACYGIAMVAGTNDPACHINMAAVMLKMPKTLNTLGSAAVAAGAGLNMIALLPPSSVSDADTSADFKERWRLRLERHNVLEGTSDAFRAGAATIPQQEAQRPLCKTTRPFKCSERQLDILECKAFIRCARAHEALAVLQAESIREMEQVNRVHDAPDLLSSVNLSAAKVDRAFSLKTAKELFEKATQMECCALDTRIHLERLQLEMDDSDLPFANLPSMTGLSPYSPPFMYHVSPSWQQPAFS